MVEQEESVEQFELPAGVGDKLRAAREAMGLSLAQLSAETRITERHLAQIEAGDFGGLPGRTYALGFSRSFARVVGLDQDEVAREVREQLSMIEPDGPRIAHSFEPGDPARVPSAKLAWFAAFAGLVLFVGGSFFIWTSFVAPAGSLDWQDSAPEQVAAPPPAEPVAPAAGDAVVFTALEEGIWVKFYDADGRQLMQKQMALGERYAVPGDVEGPQIWTGRPDALAITIGGREVPPLSQSERVMKDVPVTAAALLDREAQPGGAGASPTI